MSAHNQVRAALCLLTILLVFQTVHLLRYELMVAHIRDDARFTSAHVAHDADGRYLLVSEIGERRFSAPADSFLRCEEPGTFLGESRFRPQADDRSVTLSRSSHDSQMMCVGTSVPSGIHRATKVTIALVLLWPLIIGMVFLDYFPSYRRILERGLCSVLHAAWNIEIRGSRRSFNDDLYAMIMMMAVADGGLDSDEGEVLDDMVNLFTRGGDLEVRREITRTMSKARSGAIPFEEYARSFAQRVGGDGAALELALEYLVTMAGSNGIIEASQMRLLYLAADAFHIPRSRILELTHDREWLEPEVAEENARDARRRAEDRHTHPLEWAYRELGCSSGASPEEVKKGYRKAVQRYHPDKLIAQKLPAPLIEEGRQRFIRVQRAYEHLVSAGIVPN